MAIEITGGGEEEVAGGAAWCLSIGGAAPEIHPEGTHGISRIGLLHSFFHEYTTGAS